MDQHEGNNRRGGVCCSELGHPVGGVKRNAVRGIWGLRWEEGFAREANLVRRREKDIRGVVYLKFEILMFLSLGWRLTRWNTGCSSFTLHLASTAGEKAGDKQVSLGNGIKMAGYPKRVGSRGLEWTGRNAVTQVLELHSFRQWKRFKHTPNVTLNWRKDFGVPHW